MILYFTGTGNSRYVARIFSEVLEDELVSMNAFLKSGKRPALVSEKPYIVVCPDYAWNVPKVVAGLLKELELGGNENMYFVFTSSGDSGNAEKYAKKLIHKLSKKCAGTTTIYMPGNYIAFMQNPDPEYVQYTLQRATPHIYAIAEKIKQGEALPATPPTATGEFLSVECNAWFTTFWMKSKGFYATDKCISCGKCVTVCPMNCIELKDGKPSYGKNCTHCMACINRCPTEAIEFKTVTQGKYRYYLE